MGLSTNNNGKIEKPAERERTTLELLKIMGPQLKRAVPKHLDPDRILRMGITAISKDRDLAACSARSFLGCFMECAQLGLEPNTPMGFAYLIPRKRKGALECTLMIGYQGMIALARNSKEVLYVIAHVVRDGDDFDYELGLDPVLRHKPVGDETAQVTHAYAVAKLNNGEMMFMVLTKSQLDARRARSPAAKSGPWVTDYEAMCKKTAVRALYTWLPKSSEMARAQHIDESTETGRTFDFSQEASDALQSVDIPGDAIEAETLPTGAEGTE